MKRFLVLLLFLGIGIGLQAQSRFEDEDEQTTEAVKNNEEKANSSKPKTTAKSKPEFWQRTRFGGNLDAKFSNGFSVTVSPRMYYLASDKLWLGAGFTFIWSQKDSYPPPYDQRFIHGLNFSAQYTVLGPIFLHAEYEPLSFERARYNQITNEVTEERVWVQGLMLGGGISQNLGNGRFFFSVLYNVTYVNSFESYYTSPWEFRIGFGI